MGANGCRKWRFGKPAAHVGVSPRWRRAMAFEDETATRKATAVPLNQRSPSRRGQASVTERLEDGFGKSGPCVQYRRDKHVAADAANWIKDNERRQRVRLHSRPHIFGNHIRSLGDERGCRISGSSHGFTDGRIKVRDNINTGECPIFVGKTAGIELYPPDPHGFELHFGLPLVNVSERLGQDAAKEPVRTHFDETTL